MDILGYIIQCTQPPLSEPLLNTVFPVVINTILASDDNALLQVYFISFQTVESQLFKRSSANV